MQFVRRTALGVVFLFAAFGILAILPVRHVRSGGQPTTTLNGDVNCDGGLDVSDPIYLLSHIFLGDRAPCAIAQEPGGGGCCPGTLDALDRIAEAVETLADRCEDRLDRLVDNGDGTVTDICTGLMWQQNLTRIDVDLNGSPDDMNWFQAMNAVEDLNDAGYTDWRIPTVQELETLLRLRNRTSYYPDWFPGFHDALAELLTSTEVTPGSDHIYRIRLRPGGEIRPVPKTSVLPLLTVRGPIE